MVALSFKWRNLKRHYWQLGTDTISDSPNSTYIPWTDLSEEILKSHFNFVESARLEMSGDQGFPYTYPTALLFAQEVYFW